MDILVENSCQYSFWRKNLKKTKDVKYRKMLVVEKIEEYFKGKSFIAESIRQFDIEI